MSVRFATSGLVSAALAICLSGCTVTVASQVSDGTAIVPAASPTTAASLPVQSTPSVSPTPIPSGIAAGSTTQRLASGRTFRLHTAGRTTTPRPLVVALHPAAHNVSYMELISGLSPYADEHGFTVAYGQGVTGNWNAGGCCGDGTTNDLQYLVDLVDAVQRLTPVDASRVYLIGMSNGGMMTYRALCELPRIFAAGGVVAGALLDGVDCTHTDVRAYLIHGVNDAPVPIGGGSGYLDYDFPSQDSDIGRVGVGSVIETHDWDGGHEYPPWATDELWTWLSSWTGPEQVSAPTPGDGVD